MKKTNFKYIVGLMFLLGGIFVHGASAHAYVAFNDNSQGLDKPTLRVVNVTTNPDCVLCWTSSVSANAGDTISVDLYYHNTGDQTATNTSFNLSPKSSSASSYKTITGTASASNSGNTASGSISVSISSSQTMTYLDDGSAKWYPNQSTTPAPFPFGQTGAELVNGGLTLGNLAPGWPTQGHIVAHFIIGNNTPNPTCQINDFYSDGSDISPNSSTMLHWTTTGATSLSINPSVNGSLFPVSSGSVSTGPISSTTTYTLTAHCSNGTQTTKSTTVTVDSGQAPTITTELADNINSDSATLNGHFDSHGFSTDLWFEYGTNTSMTEDTGVIKTSSSSGDFQTDIDGLDECQTYYFKAAGRNSFGTRYGERFSFKTDCISNDDLSATTDDVTNISNGGATFNGSYDSSGNLGTIRTWFEYGTNRNTLSSDTTVTNNNNDSDDVSRSVANLDSNATYYVRFCATAISTGTDCGSVVSFYTGANSSGDLSVTTTIATSVGKYSAVLNGYVINNTGLSASAWFEYGTTTNFYQSTPFQTAGNGIQMPLAAYISGLQPSTTYYFRALAQTSEGIVPGRIENFRTGSVGSNIVYVTTPQPSLITLQILTTSQTVQSGDDVCYTVQYTNTSAKSLTNAVLSVKLPHGVDYMSASSGYLQSDTVVWNIGNIPAHGSGVILVNGKINKTVTSGDTLVTAATMTYAMPGGAQDSVIAYATQTVTGGSVNSIGVGNGFFPDTFLGWLLLILLLVLIIVIFRRFWSAENRSHYREGPPHPRA